jgi:DNA-binding response OmpR family regulator
VIGANLGAAGFEVTAVRTALAAINAVARESFDLVLVDRDLPDMSVGQACATVRELSEAPIVVLVTHESLERTDGQLIDVANDCLVKPFSPTELLFRIRAQLRAAQSPGAETLRFGDLAIDMSRGVVTLGGREVHLTRTEYRLFRVLARAPGRLMSGEQLLQEVWGLGGEHDERLIRLYVSRLRRKLGDDPERPRYVVTLAGIGYYLQRPDHWSDMSPSAAAEERRLAERRVYARIAQALVEELSLDEVARLVIAQVIEVLEASAASFYLMNQQGTALELRFASGYPTEALPVVQTIDLTLDTPSAYAARTADIAIHPPPVDGPAFAFLRDVVFPVQPLESSIALPLKARDRVLGVVTYSTTRQRRYDEEELDFLRTVANLFAAAVENSQLRAGQIAGSTERRG